MSHSDTDDVKRPAYQWYPGDFRRDVALQACAFEARALWRELLDLMHDGEPYGHLTAGGVPMNEATVARIVGVSPAKARRWFVELEAHKVFSRTDAGVIYSRRMVKDEHIRLVRADAGKKGGNPALLDNQPAEVLLKQKDKQNPTPAVAVAVAPAESTSPVIPLVGGYDAVDALCNTLPSPACAAWAAEIAQCKFGMHGPPMTEEQIGRACRDYLAQAKFDTTGMMIDPSLRHFRGFLGNAAKPPAVRSVQFRNARPSKQEAGRTSLAAWAAGDSDGE